MTARTANNPVVMAEDILSRLDQVPWPLTVFLYFRRSSESFSLVAYRSNDPECDRSREKKDWVEVGSYDRRVREADLVGDFLEAMRRVR